MRRGVREKHRIRGRLKKLTIAFRLYIDGRFDKKTGKYESAEWATYEAQPGDESRSVVITDGDEVVFEVCRSDIPWYIARYRSVIETYNSIKKYGWPFAGGWAEHPAKMVHVVTLLDSVLEGWRDGAR